LLLGDEREPHALSLAKKVAALFRISRSMRRTFTSRRRCESSSFSAVVRAPGGPLPSSTSACRHQSYTRLFASLKSFATCATLRPPRTSATVSALNSRVCMRRVRFFFWSNMWPPFYAHFPERGCPPNRVKSTIKEQLKEKLKAVTAALTAIEKQFGKGAIMSLGGTDTSDIPVIPTGSVGLDLALGVGGLPRGRVVEIFGPESSGKTTLTLHAIAQAQK